MVCCHEFSNLNHSQQVTEQLMDMLRSSSSTECISVMCTEVSSISVSAQVTILMTELYIKATMNVSCLTTGLVPLTDYNQSLLIPNYRLVYIWYPHANGQYYCSSTGMKKSTSMRMPWGNEKHYIFPFPTQSKLISL